MVYAMQATAMSSDWVGRVIDERFALQLWLGSSDGGGVFLTDFPGIPSGKAVIKLIVEQSCDPDACTAAWAEATTLSHPHLMRLLHTGRCQVDDTPLLYAVTEYAEEVLSQILPERSLTPVEAGQLLYPVLDALSYLHAHGCVHGRLKPSNLLVVDNELKLSSDRLHIPGESGVHPGKLTVYDPPEISTQPLSAASDIWSLGATLVEALTQHPPLWERSADSDPVVPASIPAPFADIAEECLRTDPARRCTLRDIHERLSPSPPLSHPDEAPAQTKPAQPRFMVLIGLFLLSAAVGALYLHSRRTPPPQSETPAAQPAVASPAQTDASVPTASAPVPPQQAEPSPPQPAAAPPPVPATQASQHAAKGAVDRQFLPDVPAKARQTIQGKVAVKVRVTVDPDGHVSDATSDSPGTSKYFANLAIQAGRQWKFQPPQVDGQAVASEWMLHFKFGRTETTVTPVQTSP
jgi:TonB family protein